MKQPRANDVDGIKEMFAEIEIIGITLPVKIGDNGTVHPQSSLGIDGLIADAGRTCYQRFPDEDDLSLEDKNTRMVNRLVNMGHLSVLEHASITVRIRGGSRAMTHQLVRHRHVAISQESQRYCDEGNFGFVVPPSIKEAGLEKKFDSMMVAVAEFYAELQKDLHEAQKQGLLSADRKVNEDARFILPSAVQSEIVITANIAEWRWIFFRRLTKHAQWEIRDIAMQCLRSFIPLTHAFDDMLAYVEEHGSMNGFSFNAE